MCVSMCECNTRQNIYRLQNHTRTTSFSILNWSARSVISSDVGLGFCRKALSRATRTVVSMDVLFFLRRPIASGVVCGFVSEPGLLSELSASSNHFWSRGLSLHIFLNDKLRASNREMVVWDKSFPDNFPIAKPTSPCVKPKQRNRKNQTPLVAQITHSHIHFAS